LIRYLGERKQFGVPLATFQLNQEKLVRMLGNIQAMWLFGWRLCSASYDVNALIVAREITGISSIRPTSRL
jgi:alkylation response protein AidB-like acyl-CoA dehydrogenase